MALPLWGADTADGAEAPLSKDRRGANDPRLMCGGCTRRLPPASPRYGGDKSRALSHTANVTITTIINNNNNNNNTHGNKRLHVK